MLQELWKSKAFSDDPIPSSILENWNKFTKENKYLNSISIPRFMGIDQNSDIILHGFCDASTKAYAAVVYLNLNKKYIFRLLVEGPDWINNDLKEELASAKILTTCTVEADSVLNSIPLVVKSNPLEPIISKFSNFTKLIRVIALCKRFINNCKSGSKGSSKLLSLNIFLDEDEILPVGGRLTKQHILSFDQKFPIIIPKHHPITTLVIRQFHLRGFHSGTQMTLSLIRQHYWIPDGRSTVRR
ncbi:uncharacterized protein TNCV_3343881 [Trichonephila clavipes]|nr:uncharacterized protein TNCV_3343881 [Trichonephila clavipes]